MEAERERELTEERERVKRRIEKVRNGGGSLDDDDVPSRRFSFRIVGDR